MPVAPSALVSGFIGLVLALLAGILVDCLVKRVKKAIPSSAPSAVIEKKWHDLTTDPKRDKSRCILGVFERILFYFSFWIGAKEIIAGWLALKVAAKWEAWGTTGKLPDAIEGIDALDYAISRRRWASQRLMSFLIGTIANLLASFVSFFIAKYVLVQLIEKYLH